LNLINRLFKFTPMNAKPAKAQLTERRRPGRPAAGNPDQRARLLDAALESYGKNGIAAASLRRIAADAGVTPAMVNYYFGSKEQLLGAVVDERLMPVVGILRERLEAAGDDPRALVTGFVHGMHAAVARYPWLPSLWVREVLSENGALRDLLITRISPQVPRVLAERLAGAQRNRILNADLDPRLLVVSLVGLTMFPLAAAPIWRRVFDAADIDDDALLRHTLALLDRGLGGSDAD
jgi:AcrR family transcriptional regulator